jgi:hypothetical protein
VLLALAEAANSDGENSCQSIARLTRMARCSESTVHRAIRSLRARGEIEFTGVNRRYMNTNTYRLPGVSLGGCQSDTPVTSDSEGVSPVTPEPTYEPTTGEQVSNEAGETVERSEYAKPQRHPSRPIDIWQPSGALLGWLRQAYPHVDVNACYTRFRNFHFAKQDTSKSWDALFENWVSNDEDRAIAATIGGTDELGKPRAQRGTSSVVGPALQPGEEGYFDPLTD